MSIRRLTHGELTLALHELALGDRAATAGGDGAGRRLLLIHELAGSTRGWAPLPDEASARFPGGVYGLDLAGHGESDWRRGGAYTPELFAADVAIALDELGACFIAGAGIGAYVALLIAGARPDLVPAALLLPGRGLAGGGAIPDFARGPAPREDVARLESAAASGGEPVRFDPLVAACLGDIRPVDYAGALADSARRLLVVEDGGPERAAPWLRAARERSTARTAPRGLGRALEALALAASDPARS